jgi:hypothetical protein
MMTTRNRLHVAISVALIALLAIPSSLVLAWKPYTHNYTGSRVLADVLPDGRVTINGREYAVRPAVAQALRDWPQFYNAGVIGPDGFPDLTFGQSIIHPENTGQWLQHIFRQAWQAQTDPSYSSAEKSQILAFAYGFLTHAAGDTWGHTLVNDFAQGVFPAVADILTSVDDAEIALRHIIIEGYVGDATSGFDGNPERGPAPGGDVSDDSTPGIAYNAPHRFVYEALIRPGAATPSPERGPLIGFFLNLRAALVAARVPAPSLSDALSAFDDTIANLEKVRRKCFEDFNPFDPTDVADCLLALAEFGFDFLIDFGRFQLLVIEETAKAAGQVFNAYLNAWIDDIDTGLRHWNELGLASTRALFDPQTRRDLQNDDCQFRGPEDSLLRAQCEDGIGIVDVLLDEADPFVNSYMLSMLGAPDFVGGLRAVIQDLSDRLDDILGPISAVLNPIRMAEAELKEFAKEKVKELIKDRYGIDVDAIKDFLTHPTHWINVTSASVDLPVLGTVTIEFFRESDHERLDAIMGLPPGHHVPSDFPFPGASTRLSDAAVVDPEIFAPLRNTVTLGKLLLLDGSELNRLLGDLLTDRGVIASASSVQTYQDGVVVPANIIVDSLPLSACPPAAAPDGAPAAGSYQVFLPLVSHRAYTAGASQQALIDCGPWLRSIDSDHAWRADGLPVFYNDAAQLVYARSDPAPLFRPDELNGGNGNFPIWESCLLRPAFRDLFVDWENTADFPDLGDMPSSDPADPNAPVSSLSVTGTTFTRDGNTYLGADHVFTLSATDSVFAASALRLQYRVYKDGAPPGEWQTLPNGDAFSIPPGAGDGLWHVEFRAEDACHTFDEADALPAGTTQRASFFLDTTPPAITITSPAAGAVFDTDDVSSIQYGVDDGPLGSGVASHSVTFDGAPATNGQVLDMFFLDPGVHAIAVTAADNLGNAGSQTRTFEVHATSESLSNNLDRAWRLGLIDKEGIYNSLKAKVEAALRAHERGQHHVEHNVLGAFVNELEAQRGKAVDLATANRFIAYAQDLIERGE